MMIIIINNTRPRRRRRRTRWRRKITAAREGPVKSGEIKRATSK